MSKSDEIRSLANKGMSVADIARRLGIRYQHAYNVLRAGNKRTTLHSPISDTKGNAPVQHSGAKPALSADDLVRAGFEFSAKWILSTKGDLAIEGTLPKAVGVYAFLKKGIAVYVGVATMGLAKRIYFYRKPGATQRTSLRINRTLKRELLNVSFIEIYTATPSDLEWNGLPVHGSAGLELGLIKKYELEWNMRGV
ncbi:MAG: GIY-YIG nuclease family protein [Pseudomonadota bacterium]